MKRLLLASFIFLTCSLLSAYAQKEAYNWMCGDTFGLNFNTPDLYPRLIKKPIGLYKFNIGFYSSIATISDSSGNYLFNSYGGAMVWNRNNQLIYSLKDADVDSINLDPNSWGWDKNNYIIRKPGSRSLYYNFFSRPNNLSRRLISCNFKPCYHVIDMDLNSGNGGMKETDVFFFDSNAIILPIRNSNNRDVWIIVFESKLEFSNLINAHSYLLTDKGLDTNNPVNSELILPEEKWLYLFNMKSTQKGDRIVCVNAQNKLGGKSIMCFAFDRTTGIVKFDKDLKPYGDAPLDNLQLGPMELSPDGSKLYTYGRAGQGNDARLVLVQIELNGGNMNIIDTLDNTNIYGHGCLQTGPGGRIYGLTMDSRGWNQTKTVDINVFSIDKPNASGKACSLKNNIINYSNYDSGLDFKNFYTFPTFLNDSYDISYIVEAKGSNHVCEGDTLFLYSSLSDSLIAENYSWSGPNGWTSDSANPVIPYAVPGMSGKYIVETDFLGYKAVDSIDIIIEPLPNAKIKGKTSLCRGESTVLSPESYCQGCSYLWSTGEKTNNIKVSDAGRFTLKITSKYGCVDSAEINVQVYELPVVEITGQNEICHGIPVTLIANANIDSCKYTWSNGALTKQITVNKPGRYEVIVRNENGCCDTAVFTVKEIPRAEIEITGKPCPEAKPILKAKPEGNGYKYFWSNGETTSQIIGDKAGIYSVIVTSPNGCSDTAQITIGQDMKVRLSGSLFFCEGRETILKTDDIFDSYQWSTGDTTREITVSDEGLYFVMVKDHGGCQGISDTVFVKKMPRPQVNIIGNTIIHPGEEITIKTDKEFSTYLWNTGETTQGIKISSGGTYSVTVIDSNGCTASASIDVKESDINITGLTDIDFGRICSGETAEKEITIKNESQDSVHIKDITFKKDAGFDSPVLKGVRWLLPDSTLSLKFSFTPQQIGYYKDTVLITTDYPFPATYTLEIKATAYAKTLVSLPDTTVSIGDNIAMPMKTELVCGNSLPPDAQYQSEISFNASALLPDPTQESGVTDNGIISGSRIFSITGAATKSIKGQIMLALQDSIPLIIKSFKWNNDLIENETKNGILRIKGLCQQNLSKIKMMNELALSVVPSPASDESEIVVTGDAKGTMSVAIYSIEGIKKGTIEINKTGYESRQKLNLKNYSSGVYHLVLQSGGEYLNVPMVVVR